MTRIAMLEPNSEFAGLYRITSCRKLYTRTGKAYIRMRLSDATGSIMAHAWEQQYKGPWQFDDFDVVELSGSTRTFNGSMVVDISTAWKSEAGKYDPVSLLPSNMCAMPVELQKLLTLFDSLQSPELRQFISDVFEDMDNAISFMRVPASLKYHHKEEGGLLRHSVECATIVAGIPMLSSIQRELAITAALFHDLGKIRTFDGLKRTEEGFLVDHQALTLELCSRQLQKLDQSAPDLGLALRHILTCRSIKRWGYEPRMSAAYAVQLADKLSVEMDLENDAFAALPASRNVSGKVFGKGGTYWRPSESGIIQPGHGAAA